MNNKQNQTGTEKKKRVPTWLIVIGVVGVIGLCGAIMSSTSENEEKSESPEEQAQDSQESTQADANSSESPEEEQEIAEENQKPEWYNQEFTIDTSKLGDLSNQTVRIWPSYDDRSEVIATLNHGDTVKLIGYSSEHDYCKITQDNNKGWLACAWLPGLPEDMTDYWE